MKPTVFQAGMAESDKNINLFTAGVAEPGSLSLPLLQSLLPLQIHPSGKIKGILLCFHAPSPHHPFMGVTQTSPMQYYVKNYIHLVLCNKPKVKMEGGLVRIEI